MNNKRYTVLVMLVLMITTMGFTRSTPPSLTGIIPLNLPASDVPTGPFIDLFDEQEKHCLALTIYGEARGETARSMEAVAWVIMNRTNSIRFPNTVCSAVLQRSQFESLGSNTTLRYLAEQSQNGTMALPNIRSRRLVERIHDIAHGAFMGTIPDPTKGATHFWSPSVQFALGRQAPVWSEKLAHHTDVGNHKFYR